MILDEWRAVAFELPVNPFYSQVIPHLKAQSRILDAGAGLGQGAEHLRSLGFDVTTLEPDPQFSALLREKGFIVVEEGFEGAPQESFDAVLCVFSLFFEKAERFSASWAALTGAVAKGGLWGGQILGDRDEWVASQPVIGFTRQEVEDLFAGFEIVEWEEVERQGRTAWGAEKHWHVHHIIARCT